MPFTTLAGLKFYYERPDPKAGPPLLFISGTGGDLRRKPNLCEPLTQGFDLVAYDQRGLGQSDKPDIAYSMADYADDAARLMDFLGWGDALVLGYSFGGMVAQELALRHPARVKRLILCCTSPGGAGGSSFPFHTLPPMTQAARAAALIPISDVRHDAAWAQANPAAHRMLIAVAQDPYADEPGHAAGARRQLEARRHHDCWDRLPQIRCPVLVAAGRYDGIAPSEIQHRLASRIPNARLQFFEGGHWFIQQDPEAITVIRAFLAASA